MFRTSAPFVPGLQPQFRGYGRASGGGFNPSAYGTVTEYLLADDIAGSDMDVITNWPAQIGNDGTPIASPILRTGANGISGKNAASLNGTDQYFQLASGISVRTVFAVVKGGTAALKMVSGFGHSGEGANASERIGLTIDATHWYSGDGGDVVLVTMVNGVTTFAHSASAREVISGVRADAITGRDGYNNLAIGGTNGVSWFWDGLISMWLAYSDAPDMATVQAAILAQYP